MRRNRLTWLAVVVVVAAAIGLIAAFAGGGSTSASRGGHDNDSAASLSSAPRSGTTPAATTGAVKGAQAALTGGGRLVSGSTNLLALGDSERARLVGRPVSGLNVQISSLAGHDGFWIGGGANRMRVHVTGGNGGLAVGDIVSFHGTLARDAAGTAGTHVRVDVRRSSLKR